MVYTSCVIEAVLYRGHARTVSGPFRKRGKIPLAVNVMTWKHLLRVLFATLCLGDGLALMKVFLRLTKIILNCLTFLNDYTQCLMLYNIIVWCIPSQFKCRRHIWIICLKTAVIRYIIYPGRPKNLRAGIGIFQVFLMTSGKRRSSRHCLCKAGPVLRPIDCARTFCVWLVLF